MKLDRAETKSLETADLEPESAEDYYNLGNQLQQQGQTEAAIAAYSQAIELQPQYAQAHNNLGAALESLGQIEAALSAYSQAIELQPTYAEAHNNLGAILQGKGEIEAALSAYSQAIELKPDYAEAYCNLATGLHEQGQTEAALLAYHKAIELQPDYHLAKLGLAISQIPIIYSNSAEIELTRNNYRHYLHDLARYYQSVSEQERAEAATAVGWRQPFYLAYQGLSDRSLQQTYGTMIHSLMASRYPQWTQPKPIPALKKEQKIRIGFVSGFFHRHSVWKIPLQGWVENLDRSEFELYGYYTGTRKDLETARAAKAFDQFEHEPRSVEQWAEKITSDDLHVLIYAEFGMDIMTLKLGCLKLAPVQLVFGGHPETSGLPTIDYHLTSDLMEPENGSEHYTEKLVRLPNLGICYQLLSIKPKAIAPQDYGIQENEIMFWCCQSLFKYLPQHDDIFPRIARELPHAKFVFIELASKFATDTFRQRLQGAFAQFDLDDRDYCLFLPRLSANAFNGTTAIADVFLDNISWSGNNTVMESTAYNLPVVTLPGDLMRGRHALAILTMMGVTETIAKNKDEYIQIAVRLGRDKNYRQQVARQMAIAKQLLYQDLQPVRALENFIFKILNKPRQLDDKVIEAFQLAVQHHQANRLNQARQEYLKVLAVRPEHPETLYGLGAIARQLGQLEESEQYLSASVRAQPELLKAWFSLGNLRQGRGQFTAAEAAYRQALQLQPNSAPICNNLGYVLQQQDKWSAAATYYKQALDLMPNCVEADVNWGNALFARGQLSPEKQIHYAELNYKLGLGRHRVKDWQNASIYYRQAISMQPDLVDAHYHLGLALQQQRKLSEAIACYQQVLQLNSNYEAVYYSLGQIYQDLGDLEGATRNFQQGLKLINPDYARVERSWANTATFADNFIVPQIPQGEVTVGNYKFPAIPKVSESEAKRPFWSVVIPVVNRPEYFPECLASVLAQWTADMEIIVLDNGSEPAQWQIPQDLGRGIIRYYRFPQTVSLQENWNTAISLCRGQWIHLLHHDDYVFPKFYASFQASLQSCPKSVGAAFTGYEMINQERQIIHTEQYGLENYRGIVRDWVQQIGVVNTTSPPSLVIKRAAYEELGGYKLDILYTCDWELYKRIASFYDWWYEPGILAHYRQQSNSITISENTNGNSGYDHLRAIEISESYLPTEHRAEITTRSRVNYFYWCLERAKIPLRVGNLDGALQLIKAALKINSSPQVVSQLSLWLQQEAATTLVYKLTSLDREYCEEEERILVNLAKNCYADRK